MITLLVAIDSIHTSLPTQRVLAHQISKYHRGKAWLLLSFRSLILLILESN